MRISSMHNLGSTFARIAPRGDAVQLLAPSFRSGVARWRPAVASLALCTCGARSDPGPKGRRCSGTTRGQQSSDESPSPGCPPVGQQMSLTATSDVRVLAESLPATFQAGFRSAKFVPMTTEPFAFLDLGSTRPRHSRKDGAVRDTPCPKTSQDKLPTAGSSGHSIGATS